MNDLLLMSIQTKYANEIFNGNKRYEYRKSTIGDNNLNKKIFIYSAGVDKAIIGYMIVDKVLCGDVKFIIEETNPKDNISDYYKSVKKAYALHIKSYFRFKNPITLADLRKIDKNISLPQYYKYIKVNSKLYDVLMLGERNERV